jgi:type IV/VI secretion system ImpK/VasF family protein
VKQLFSLTIDQLSESNAQRNTTTHYRSKLYTSKAGVNPLVAAAQPLFSILERINLSENPPDLNLLQANLAHELQAFMANATSTEHIKEMIFVARYLLCATIDEVIEKAYNKRKEALAFEKLTALQEIPDSTELASPDVYFFQILDNALHKPDFYLDVIELIYFCLITGFEGKYRQDPNGKQTLENLLDRLYQVIQEQRPSAAEKLFVSMAPNRRFAFTKAFPWRWITIAFVGILISGYVLVSYQLNQHASHMLTSSLDKNGTERTY